MVARHRIKAAIPPVALGLFDTLAGAGYEIPPHETGPDGLTGLAHRPLVALAVLIQVLALFDPAGDIGGIAALVVFGFWMPAMLVSAVVWAYDQTLVRAITLAAIPYVLWLATAGRYLFIQVGHLF